MKITPRKKRGDFLARSRFARFPIPEEKWGTTRSLACRVLSGRESRNLIQKRCRKTESLLGSRLATLLSDDCGYWLLPFKEYENWEEGTNEVGRYICHAQLFLPWRVSLSACHYIPPPTRYLTSTT